MKLLLLAQQTSPTVAVVDTGLWSNEAKGTGLIQSNEVDDALFKEKHFLNRVGKQTLV